MRLSVAIIGLLLSSPFASSQPYSNCGTDDYYSGLTGTWTRPQVHQLIQSTHIAVPINSNTPRGNGDVWQALMELDAGENPDTVHLIYANEDVDTKPFGGDYWNKEYVWPVTRGIDLKGPDLTDVHNIRPVSKIGKLNRLNKYFGECGVLEYGAGTCTEPAEGGDSTTCSCNRAYQPPENVRGQIARALLYMDLRYDGDEADTKDLRLTDCPFQPPTDMAYLSQVLNWNNDYPPDDAEKARNQMVCENWQGNRNPFVDFPELANSLYPDPLPDPVAGREIYEACEDIPTNAPTLSPNDCDTVGPGSLAFFFMNSFDPDEVAFYVFDDLPGDMKLYLTDNAWDGLEFRNEEGVVSYVTPTQGIPGGTWFGYGTDAVPKGNDWTVEEGVFSLSTSGEQIFLYCYSASGDINHLSALSYNGPFQEPGLFDYGFNESALPSSLEADGAIILPYEVNYIYDGPQSSDGNEYKILLKDATNWKGSSARYSLTLPSASGATTVTPGMLWMAGVAGVSMLAALFQF